MSREKTRIYFATDIHGSRRCWLKFLNAAEFYECEVLLMGGDFTGKMIVPLVKAGKKRYRAQLNGRQRELHERDIDAVERQICDSGFYPYRTDEEEMEELRGSRERVDSLFLRLMDERVREWLELAQQRLAPRGVRCFFGAGNDDPPAIDAILDEYTASSGGTLVHCNDRVVSLADGHEMVSLGTSNQTPWNTPREATEEELRARIDELASEVDDLEHCIFNLHVPPYRTRIDEAPELDDDMRPVTVGGQVSMTPVGSTAVRESIEQHQPLVALHGHIHESKGFVKLGRTICINPGSEYGDGVLDGAVVELDGLDVKYTLVSG
jgi:Icc-related predicted phosphoesterase